MDAFGVLRQVLDDYKSFVQGFLNIRDPEILRKVEQEVSNGLMWPEPWLALNPAFESGGTVSDLVERGWLHPGCREIFRARTPEDPFGHEIAFHKHQSDAIEIASRRESYVLTTGTGSGKSMSYIVPIVDRVLRDGSGQGVRAIVVYPMNALANSQRGELEKFLGKEKPTVSFARYTGQENRADRDAILANPPDILLTNYVMLELMLTRPKERGSLIRSAENLSFLVLDELHTYRGRQGADVAMLIRRLRAAIGAVQLQCVGTSATLAGPGTRAEQRAEVAALASRLFGTPIPATNIVGESLRRATAGDTDPDHLRARVASTPPATHAALQSDDLAVWIEQTFGLREDDEGKLARQSPTRLVDAAAELAATTGELVADCEQALRDTLLAGSRARDAEGRSLFAFKLHQFIGKGDTAYVTLNRPGDRYLTTQYQRSAPDGPAGQPLFPLAFCRECGQDYLVVNRERGGERFTPRVLTGGSGDATEATGLLLITDTDWPDQSSDALLDLVPEDWIIETGGVSELDRARRPRLPHGVRVDSFGVVTDDGVTAVFFEKLHFCPTCKTTYESTAQSEFSRVASLGTEGRASAVTVLSQAVVRTLREADDLDPEARKFLAFSDNRQDASLQAGHFNDFVLVGLVRSAVYQGVLSQRQRNPDEPLTDEDLGRRVVECLKVTLADYAGNPDVEYAAKDKTVRALRESVAYRVWADLRRGWRITMPNRAAWREQAINVLGNPRTIARMVATVTGGKRQPAPAVTEDFVAATATTVVGVVQSGRATWQVWHVRAEAERQARAAGIGLNDMDSAVDRITAAALAPGSSIRLGVDDPIVEPAALRRSDGSSVYLVAGSRLYTSQRIIDAEHSLLAAAQRRDGRTISDTQVGLALAESAANRFELNPAQAQMVRELATSGARVQVAIAPAGSGKTTAMRVLSRAWTDSGGDIIGLAPSARAAAELRREIQTRSDTLAKLTWSLTTGFIPKWVRSIGPQTLVIIDEAGMAGTGDLAQAVDYITSRGGSVRLVGDDQQLASIAAGGVLRDIAEQVGVVTLSELQRFADPAEGAATLALRLGDPAAIGFYLDNSRVHVGDKTTVTDHAYQAWSTDRANGLDAVMLAPTRDLVSTLNARARTDRLAVATDKIGREVLLADGNRASAGDTIITRMNNRELPISSSDWVKNGDRWRVDKVQRGGSVVAVHLDTNRKITLPSDYVREHTELGYACTVHGAQGITADACHTVASGEESRQLFYVAMTRGRTANHVYLVTASDGDPHNIVKPEALFPLTATDILTGILDRDQAQQSAASIARELEDPAVLLHDAAGRYHDALGFAAEQIVGAERLAALDEAAERIRPGLTDAPAYPTLRAHLALLAVDGTDPITLLDRVAGPHARELNTALDPAAVLDWRLDPAGQHNQGGPLPWLPAVPAALTTDQ